MTRIIQVWDFWVLAIIQFKNHEIGWLKAFLLQGRC